MAAKGKSTASAIVNTGIRTGSWPAVLVYPGVLAYSGTTAGYVRNIGTARGEALRAQVTGWERHPRRYTLHTDLGDLIVAGHETLWLYDQLSDGLKAKVDTNTAGHREEQAADARNEADRLRREAAQNGERGTVHTTQPSQPGFGTSRTWSRQIAGTLYSFTVVTMPDGEVRWFASRFNGYVGGPSFACAWDQVSARTFRPTGGQPDEQRDQPPSDPITPDAGTFVGAAEDDAPSWCDQDGNRRTIDGIHHQSLAHYPHGLCAGTAPEAPSDPIFTPQAPAAGRRVRA
jgi:hypothetical protein